MDNIYLTNFLYWGIVYFKIGCVASLITAGITCLMQVAAFVVKVRD